MEILQLPDGKLRIPVRAEGDNIIGDAVLDIGPEHPDYDAWVNYLKNSAKEIHPKIILKARGGDYTRI